MLIKSFHIDEPRIQSIRRILNVSENGSLRLDTWMVIDKHYTNDTRTNYLKLSHFGNLISPNHMRISDFMSVLQDEKHRVKQIHTSIEGYGDMLGGSSVQTTPNNFIDINGLQQKAGSVIVELDGIEYIAKSSHLSDNKLLVVDTDIFENEMDAPYRIFGSILATLTSVGFHAPFKANYIFDAYNGFNIRDLVLNGDSYHMDITALRYSLKEYMRLLNNIGKSFQYECDKCNTPMRVHAHTNGFGGVADIFNMAFPNVKFRTHISHTDHTRIIRTLDATDPQIHYSNMFHNALSSPLGLASLFDSEEEKRLYKTGCAPIHYSVDFEED